MDAVSAPADWAAASLGASCRVSPAVVLRGAFSALFLSPQVSGYGGELSLNVLF